MKKVTLLGIVLILLAYSVAPVMAATSQSNGHGNGQGNGQGNGNSAGQTNNGGNGDQTKDRNRTNARDQIKLNNPGRGANRSAGGNNMRMRTPFYLQGIVTAVVTPTVTITLTHGNAQVKQFFDTGLTVTVTQSTMIFKLTQGLENEGASSTTEGTNDEGTPGNRVPITFKEFAALAVGHKVAIHGNLVNGVYTARLITLYIQTPTSETVETP